MSGLDQWLKLQAQVRDEWQSNKRLQVIAAISAVLFVVWCSVQLEAWRSVNKTDARAAFEELQDIKLATDEQRWPSRALAAQAQLAAVQKWLWSASSEGEAQAGLRDWLELQARNNGVIIDTLTIDVGKAPRGMKLRPVRAELRGQYKVGAWQQFIHAITTATPVVVVESDELNFSRPKKPLYRIAVTAWFDLHDRGLE